MKLGETSKKNMEIIYFSSENLQLNFFRGKILYKRFSTLFRKNTYKFLNFCSRDHYDKKRVYPTDVTNAYDQMPIHIAARNRKCSPHVIQLLAKDLPASLQV